MTALSQNQAAAELPMSHLGLVSYPVRGQVDAALLALSEGFRHTVRITENQLHVIMVHQHTGGRNKRNTTS